jgi:major intracellular serine protease
MFYDARRFRFCSKVVLLACATFASSGCRRHPAANRAENVQPTALRADASTAVPAVPGCYVAVIDSGVARSHPLFRDRFATMDSVRSHLIPPLVGNADALFYGWDFKDADALPDDRVGHGTHTAGIVIQELDKNGGSGTSSVRLIIFRTGDFSHDLRPITETLKTIAKLRAHGWKIPVVLCPFEYHRKSGDKESFNAFATAMEEMLASGVLCVAASGGQGQNNDASEKDQHTYPSDFPHPNLISVACCTDDGFLNPLSNYGAISVDLAAPGFGVSSATLKGDFSSQSGSSQSAALVAARAMAKWLSSQSSTPASIREQLFRDVIVHPSLLGKVATGGYLRR